VSALSVVGPGIEVQVRRTLFRPQDANDSLQTLDALYLLDSSIPQDDGDTSSRDGADFVTPRHAPYGSDEPRPLPKRLKGFYLWLKHHSSFR